MLRGGGRFSVLLWGSALNTNRWTTKEEPSSTWGSAFSEMDDVGRSGGDEVPGWRGSAQDTTTTPAADKGTGQEGLPMWKVQRPKGQDSWQVSPATGFLTSDTSGNSDDTRTGTLNATALLRAIREDPGMTTEYYAEKYFGGEKNIPKVKHLLWCELKRYGVVELDRRVVSAKESIATDNDETAAEDQQQQQPVSRWYPAASRHFPVARVQHHRDEDEDLSILQRSEARQALHQQGSGPSSGSPAQVATGNIHQGSPSVGAAAGQEEDTAAAAVTVDPSRRKALESVKPVILGLVSRTSDREIHFYVRQMENDEEKICAPLAFKELRLTGLLERYRSTTGGFLWKSTNPVKGL